MSHPQQMLVLNLLLPMRRPLWYSYKMLLLCLSLPHRCPESSDSGTVHTERYAVARCHAGARDPVSYVTFSLCKLSGSKSAMEAGWVAKKHYLALLFSRQSL